MTISSTLRIALLLAFTMPASCMAPPDSYDSAARVFIVRHAEKLAGDDPDLALRGLHRAERLADLLEDRGITEIFSTDTRRTRATAAPLARRLGIVPRLYAPDAQDEVAASIAAAGKTVLVVGHSNTIGEMAAAFGVDPGSPVADDEYDRLYVITLEAGHVRGETRRYGED